MTMASYAQNFEDVILQRALRFVGIGCYLDVGASLPHKDSVSYAFYRRGDIARHIGREDLLKIGG
jgi:hypothetical protein